MATKTTTAPPKAAAEQTTTAPPKAAAEQTTTAPPKAAAKVAPGYETFDGNEALAFNQAGGRLIAITKRYPKHPFKPGKRYRFLESKAALDQLLAQTSAEEARG